MNATLPPLSEIDALLASHGDFGSDEWSIVKWSLDRPFLPSEAYDMARRHDADPHTADIAFNSCTLRDAAAQLRNQAASFSACAQALLANLPSLLDAFVDSPGSGIKEAQRFLALEREILGPGGISEPSARDALKKEREALAARYAASASACLDAAAHVDGIRAKHHHERLARRALSLAEAT